MIDICSISNILIWSGHAKKCRLNVLSYIAFQHIHNMHQTEKKTKSINFNIFDNPQNHFGAFLYLKLYDFFINHIMFDSNIWIWIAIFITMHSTFLDITFNRFYDYHYASGNITYFRFMLRHYLICLNLCDTLDW